MSRIVQGAPVENGWAKFEGRRVKVTDMWGTPDEVFDALEAALCA